MKHSKVTKLDKAFFDQHMMFKSVEAIQTIMKPLLRLGFENFVYHAVFPDHSHIRLSSNANWLVQYYKNSWFTLNAKEQFGALLISGILAWHDVAVKMLPYDIMSRFNAENGIMIVITTDTQQEYFNFSFGSHSPLTIDIALSYKQELYRFVAYFKSQAATLIKEANHHRIQLHVDKNDDKTNTKHTPQTISFTSKKSSLIHKLTERETDIADLLTRGFGTKQVANHLDISIKTVDTHISNIKNKLSYQQLFQLGFNTWII